MQDVTQQDETIIYQKIGQCRLSPLRVAHSGFHIAAGLSAAHCGFVHHKKKPPKNRKIFRPDSRI